MPPLIYGIYREQALSPGKIREDAAILDEVLYRLGLRGWEAITLRAEDLSPQPPAATGVLHMAQGPPALHLLTRWEQSGLPLINPPGAVRGCYRRQLFPLLARRGLPSPYTKIFSLPAAQTSWIQEFPGPGWLKRAEMHAESPGDVVQVATWTEAQEVLADFAQRQINYLVWQEHVPGKEIKFYAVGPGRFFQAFWAATGEPLPETLMTPVEELASQAARLINLLIYGGDIILTPERRLVLIDLNDWPSFSLCREAAAQEIAHYVESIWGL